jgi:hypothetical protein
LVSRAVGQQEAGTAELYQASAEPGSVQEDTFEEDQAARAVEEA